MMVKQSRAQPHSTLSLNSPRDSQEYARVCTFKSLKTSSASPPPMFLLQHSLPSSHPFLRAPKIEKKKRIDTAYLWSIYFKGFSSIPLCLHLLLHCTEAIPLGGLWRSCRRCWCFCGCCHVLSFLFQSRASNFGTCYFCLKNHLY